MGISTLFRVRVGSCFALVTAALWTIAPLHSEPWTEDAKQSTIAIFGYGRCVVDRSPVQTRRIFSFIPGSKQERELLRSVTEDRCLNGYGASRYFDVQPQMFRGAIAEAILHADAEHKRRASKVDVTAPFATLSATDVAALSQSGRMSLLGLDFAQCLVSVDSAAITALLDTYPTSPKESQAFSKLAPQMGPCLPNGAQIAFAKPELRGFLAEAAYRAAFAANQAK